MLKSFTFNYSAIVENNGGDIVVKGYNSPYPLNQDKQSIDDILYAIDQLKIKIKGKTKLKILCRFIENEDGTYNQLFKLLECEKLKEI